MAQGKIRIRLKGYDHQQLDRSAQQIVDTAQRSGATITGPVPLPTEKNVYCVIRSPFKDKDSREHFEVRTHKRLIDILSPTPKTIDQLMRLDLPAGIDIEIKLLMARASLGRKLGMTQIFDPETGAVTAVTVIEAGPCPVVQVKTTGHGRLRRRPARVRPGRGLEADAARARPPEALRRRRRTGRSSSSAAGSTAPSRARRSRSRSSSPATRSRSPGIGIGKGFQGTIKRHNFSSGPRAHGSHNIRAPGSIGASATPSRVFKGIKMAGRMGGKRVTQLGLKVHSVDAERNLLLVAGLGPGPEERPRRGARLMAAPKASVLSPPRAGRRRTSRSRRRSSAAR